MVRVRDEARGTMLEEPQFEEAVRRLTSVADTGGVLSVYLDIDPSAATREGYEAALIELWKPLVARFEDPWLLGRLEYEIEAVVAEVRSWEEAPGRSVAMFFSGPGGIRMLLPLQFPVPSVARFEPRPVVAPLIAALDEHRRYGVVMFDKSEARLITVFLGQVEEETRLTADVTVGRTEIGGWGGYMQARYARHREHHLAEHARRVVEHLWAMDRSRPMHAVVLAGPDEALSVLRRALPPALARSVAGQVAGEMFASTADVVQHVAAIEEQSREREDREAVEQIEQRLGKHSDVTVGWDETLQALAEGRVHLLLLPAGAASAGVQCPSEDFLATVARETCPICGEALFATNDIVEAAVRTALHRDSLVRFLAPEASKLLSPRGIAALLRY